MARFVMVEFLCLTWGAVTVIGSDGIHAAVGADRPAALAHTARAVWAGGGGGAAWLQYSKWYDNHLVRLGGSP
jgi:hypothetical protein